MLLYEIYMYGWESVTTIGYYYSKSEERIKEEVNRLKIKLEKDRELLEEYFKHLDEESYWTDEKQDDYERVAYTVSFEEITYKIIDLDEGIRMKKETITKYLIKTLNEIKAFEVKVNNIYKEGLCLANFLDDQYVINNNLFKCFLTEEGVDNVMWWLYENINPKIFYFENKTKEINVDKVEDIVYYIVENNLLGV